MSADKRKALGRGLDTLLPAARATAAAPTTALQPGELVRDIAVEKIDRNPYQTRGHVDETALNELAASIKASGVLQPIVVRPAGDRFQLIAGERRWLASQKAGRPTVPAIVRQVSNEQAMEMTIVENLQREDLNPLEQAKAFERLSREFGLTQEQMSQRTGKDRSSISNYLRMLRLPTKTQDAIGAGQLTFGHAKVLMGLEAPELIEAATVRVQRDSLSVRQTEELVESLLHPREKQAASEKPVDPNVREAERHLQQSLGLKVTILDRKGKGKIVIQYGSLEDFDRVIEQLS
jgi:ParB family chromosome partitioning protein